MTTKIDLSSAGLLATARARGWWDGEAAFSWAEVMSAQRPGSLASPDTRWRCGAELLQERARSAAVTASRTAELRATALLCCVTTLCRDS